MNGIDQLAEYRERRSESAFSGLVGRYTNLVYSAALRKVANSALAEDVVQSVFIRLAKSPPPLKSEAQLAAWLHRTAIHAAIDAWRSEARRREREKHAMESAPMENSGEWEEIAPCLDESLDQLGSADRQVLLLRFFEQKSMREVGKLLGISEDAAKMRVSRALEKLRSRLASRGVGCGAPALGILLSRHTIEAAPRHLLLTLNSPQFLAGLTTGAGAAGIFSTLVLMSKVKLTSALVLVAAIGIGVVGIYRATISKAPFGGNIPETVMICSLLLN